VKRLAEGLPSSSIVSYQTARAGAIRQRCSRRLQGSARGTGSFRHRLRHPEDRVGTEGEIAAIHGLARFQQGRQVLVPETRCTVDEEFVDTRTLYRLRSMTLKNRVVLESSEPQCKRGRVQALIRAILATRADGVAESCEISSDLTMIAHGICGRGRRGLGGRRNRIERSRRSIPTARGPGIDGATHRPVAPAMLPDRSVRRGLSVVPGVLSARLQSARLTRSSNSTSLEAIQWRDLRFSNGIVRAALNNHSNLLGIVAA